MDGTLTVSNIDFVSMRERTGERGSQGGGGNGADGASRAGVPQGGACTC